MGLKDGISCWVGKYFLASPNMFWRIFLSKIFINLNARKNGVEKFTARTNWYFFHSIFARTEIFDFIFEERYEKARKIFADWVILDDACFGSCVGGAWLRRSGSFG